MLNFFRRIRDRRVAEIETRFLQRRVDDSEVCVISVDSLRCSICYTVFNGTPMVLQCGHSFCAACVSRMMAETACPMCRKPVNFKFAAKNYALKSILDSLDEISAEEERAGRAYANTAEVTKEALREQLAEAKAATRRLEMELQKSKEDAIQMLIIIVFVVILMLLFWKIF